MKVNELVWLPARGRSKFIRRIEPLKRTRYERDMNGKHVFQDVKDSVYAYFCVRQVGNNYDLLEMNTFRTEYDIRDMDIFELAIRLQEFEPLPGE